MLTKKAREAIQDSLGEYRWNSYSPVRSTYLIPEEIPDPPWWLTEDNNRRDNTTEYVPTPHHVLYFTMNSLYLLLFLVPSTVDGNPIIPTITMLILLLATVFAHIHTTKVHYTTYYSARDQETFKHSRYPVLGINRTTSLGSYSVKELN